MRDLDDLFSSLQRSRFRARFELRGQELTYLHEKGVNVILDHARDFISERLAPAHPAKDGKQTPMANHPVFIAQHATATCCRGCLAKWHRIPAGRVLTDEEQRYIVKVIERWLAPFASSTPPRAARGSGDSTKAPSALLFPKIDRAD